jgi:argininosuccinate lyase
MKKLWGGRFTGFGDKWIEEFNASIQFDKELVFEDIKGSLAHAKMLAKQGILTNEEFHLIEGGLKTLQTKAENNELEFYLQYEDIHLNLEKQLTELIGPVGGKLHTARSRNDQVATDVHLYVVRNIDELIEKVTGLQKALFNIASDNIYTIIPGYTHLQRAQPISYAHHFMAYFWMLERDKNRLVDCKKRANISPLGSGALAGTTFNIDNAFTASTLGFDGNYENSIDGVSDRDFVLELLSGLCIMQMHLSRLCEEIILWSSNEFNFIELDDTYSTGSSIMPQKKNPDVAELVRGKTGRVYGNLISLLTTMKGLPLAYNKDMQEDKEPLFDSVQTMQHCLFALTGCIETAKVKKEELAVKVSEDFSNATEVADYLASKGIPFREAHEITGKIVLYCIQNNKFLKDMSMDEYLSFDINFKEDIYEVIKPEVAVERRNSLGGTSFEQVKLQLEKAEKLL